MYLDLPFNSTSVGWSKMALVVSFALLSFHLTFVGEEHGRRTVLLLVNTFLAKELFTLALVSI